MVVSFLDRLNHHKGGPIRLLLVYPEFPISFYSYYYVGKYFGRAKSAPPTGLLTIAAMCPKDWDIRLIDENAEPLKDSDLEWADVVGVSAMIVQYTRAVEVARRARAKGKPTMIGGNHVTAEPDAYRDEFDVLVRNEGEITFRQLLNDYGTGRVGPLYETSEKADLSQTPVYRMDLIGKRHRYPMVTLQYSRGCPHSCEFCDVVSMLGHRVRYRDVKDVITELGLIHATGHRGVVFLADDSFGANKRKSIELCHAMAEWNRENGYPFFYGTQATMQSMSDDEMLEAMRLARFGEVFLGLETPSPDTLQGTGKSHNLNMDAASLVRKIRSYGIRVNAGIVIGFDGDMPDIFDRQIEFVRSLSSSIVQASLLSAFPGTPLHKRLKAEGRLLYDPTPLQVDGGLGHFNCVGLPNIVPKNMKPSELMAGYARLVTEIYHPRQFFDRAVEEIAQLRPDFRNWLLALRIYLVTFPLWSLFIVAMFRFRFHFLWAVLRILVRCPTHLVAFREVSMRSIHCLEFARRDVIPRAQEDARRLALLEARPAPVAKPERATEVRLVV